MNRHFHYDIIYILALKAGFNAEDSYKIAYSSQYVDDNNEEFTILENSTAIFTNQISQTMNILKPQSEQLRIYPCFHFIPGDLTDPKARRIDNLTHSLNTTPNSSNARLMMNEALKTNNVYRIGIAVHAYADTWAHQNFIGANEGFNSLDNFLIPNIGHADAFQRPDIPRLVWKDKRLIPENQIIDNKTRFLEAAENIYTKFKKNLLNSISGNQIKLEWEYLESELNTAFGETVDERDVKLFDEKNITDNIESYRQQIAGTREYDKEKWFKDAVKIEKRDIPEKIDERTIRKSKHLKKNDFETSDWYQFQLAVIEHQNFVTEILADEFSQSDLQKK